MNKFVLIEPGGDITRLMMSDLENREDVEILYQPFLIKNKLLKFIREKHLSYKLNKNRVFPFQAIWRKFYSLSQYKFSLENEYYIIMGNAVLSMIDDNYLRCLSRKNNIHLVLYFSDPVDAFFTRLAKVKAQRNSFDYIFTFDPADAKKYGYVLMRNIYSTSNVAPSDHRSDVCFIGENKGRQSILEEIYTLCEENKVITNFRMTRVENPQKAGIIYNQRISYLESIADAKSTNCLLEILQEGQSGVSFRYYEAICYNRKLLTNNPEIFTLPYYDERFMRYFKELSDIDFEWLRKKETVDYHYAGDFSPIRFIELLQKSIKQ